MTLDANNNEERHDDVINIEGNDDVSVTTDNYVVTVRSTTIDTNEVAGPSSSPDVHIVQVRHAHDNDAYAGTSNSGVGTSNSDVGSPSNVEVGLGRCNHGYTYDCMEMLPVLTDLQQRCRHHNNNRYSVSMETSDTEDSDSSPDPSCKQWCSCTCHATTTTTEDDEELPSYESVVSKGGRTDLVVHDDIECTGVKCKHAPPHTTTHNNHNKHHNHNNHNLTIDNTPTHTPGGSRKFLSDRILNISSSSLGKCSPVLGKEPPNYRSLIFSILQDEPPKYEEVTGKKLADELVSPFLNDLKMTNQTFELFFSLQTL